MIISKAETSEKEAYSGFQGTDLDRQLKDLGIRRVLVGGLATDYCVKNTVLDALKLGYAVYFLPEASRPVNLRPGDGEKALEEMSAEGAVEFTGTIA